MRRIAFHKFALLVVLFFVTSARAENWPAWRGPTGQGFSKETNVPTTWSDTKNVKWKVALEHQGNSTPIVWDDKIFLTQANKFGKTRSLLCLDRDNGKILWQKDVEYPEKETSWNANWYCNASPTTDGERVVVSFGSAGMYCYDFAGKELWKRTDLGKWEDPFGNASSPVIYKDLAILWCGPNRNEGRNYLLAVDKKTGKTVWEHDEKVGSWATPLIVSIDGKDQLILGMSPDDKRSKDPKTSYLKGYDPNTGKELWLCKGINSYVYSSAIFGEDIAVCMSGYGGAAIAVKVKGTGDITKNRLWIHPKNVQRVGSGMIVDGHVYLVDEKGNPRCYDLKSGEEVWKVDERPVATNTWGSMVYADGKLYVMMRNGTTAVFKASPKYQVVSLNQLDAKAQTNSSPVISNGEIFLRTFTHLYCIAEKQ